MGNTTLRKPGKCQDSIVCCIVFAKSAYMAGRDVKNSCREHDVYTGEANCFSNKKWSSESLPEGQSLLFLTDQSTLNQNKVFPSKKPQCHPDRVKGIFYSIENVNKSIKSTYLTQSKAAFTPFPLKRRVTTKIE